MGGPKGDGDFFQFPPSAVQSMGWMLASLQEERAVRKSSESRWEEWWYPEVGRHRGRWEKHPGWEKHAGWRGARAWDEPDWGLQREVLRVERQSWHRGVPAWGCRSAGVGGVGGHTEEDAKC